VLKFRARHGEKFFHYLFTISSLVGAIAYFAQASDLFFDTVAQAHQLDRSGLTRQIFWPKYLFWIVEFGNTILALGVVSGVSWATIIFNTALSTIWVVSYAVASATSTKYKWGFFSFGTLALFFLLVGVVGEGLKSANRVGVKSDYLVLSAWVALLWVLYPLAWGLTDGGNYLGVTPSFIWFGILDVLLTVFTGFAWLFVFAPRWDYGKLNVAFTQYGRVAQQAGTFPEKDSPAQPTNA
jgi:bacteriorhodopsin